jgi:hypothetical protein
MKIGARNRGVPFEFIHAVSALVLLVGREDAQ